MKLNKKGWGVFQMIWMTGIILFFFLLVIILIYNHYRYLGRRATSSYSVSERNREEMVDDLNDAAKKYVDHYYANLKNLGEVRLTSDKLFQSGLFPKDLYGGCTGYALARKTDGITYSRAFIKCDDYKSPGYDKY